MSDTKFVTSISNCNDGCKCFPVRALIYAQTLNRFYDKEDIIILATPPELTPRQKRTISRSATVIEVPNQVPKFSFVKGHTPRRLGEVVSAWKYVNAKNVFITDTDIIVYKNPKMLLEGDFDVAGRVADGYLNKKLMSKFQWKRMMKEYHIPRVVPMLNKGFILFKNWTFNDTCRLWHDLMFVDLPNPTRFNKCNFKDQYALAIAIGIMDLKIKEFNAMEVAFGWNDEETSSDSTILHSR